MVQTQSVEPESATPVAHRPVVPATEGQWRWVLVLGAVQVVVGVLALSSLLIATLASVVAFGIFLVAAGIIHVVLAFTGRRGRAFFVHLIGGILAGVVGLMLIGAPVVGAEVLTALLAAWLLVSGAIQVIYSLVERYRRWGWTFTSGAVSFLLGLLLFAQFPVAALWFPGLAIGLALILYGVTFIALGIADRPPTHRGHAAAA
jgi:uncharacterized membrane protein HdeD (DUF308 family)